MAFFQVCRLPFQRDEAFCGREQLLLVSEVYNLEPWVFVPLNQRSGNKRPWKVLIGSPKISDFRLNYACLAFKNVTQKTSWFFTPGQLV